MKRTCPTIQARLLDHGGADDKNVRTHLDSCPDCRRFAETWHILRSAHLPDIAGSPPERVDFDIRREAFEFAADRTRRHHALTRWISLAAIAACVTLIAGVALSLFHADSPAQMPLPSASLAQAADFNWSQLDLDEDLFELNADLEITFAMLTLATSPVAAEPPTPSTETGTNIAL